MRKRWLLATWIMLFIVSLLLIASACGMSAVNVMISFDVDGTIEKTISTSGKEVVKMPEDPTKEGYTFDGWYWDKDTWEKPFTANSLLEVPLSSNMTVYARFTIIPLSEDPTHVHEYGDWEIVNAATCTTPGLRKQVCICGKENIEILEVIDHTEVIDAVVSATCIESGLTEGKHCSVCGTVLTAQEEVDPLGHDYGEWSVFISATCIKEGEERRNCSRCVAFESRTVEIDSDNHDLAQFTGKEATCISIGWKDYVACSRCGYTTYEEIAFLDHEYVESIVEPTCTENGYTAHICKNCDNTYKTDETLMLGHSFGEWTLHVLATCVKEGEEQRICSRCETIDSRTVDMDPSNHELIHHEAKEATCVAVGWYEYDTCSRCNYSNYIEIAALAHSYASIVTAPTCTVGGYTTYICSRCTDSYISNRTDAKGHREVIDPAKTATCTETGLTEGKHCSVCNEILIMQDVRPALGHLPIEIPAVEATTTESGLTAGSKCARCGEILQAQVVVFPSADMIDLMLNRTELYLDIGQTYQLSAIPVPGNAKMSAVVWLTSNDNVAIDSDGNLHALSVGPSIVAAMVGELSVTCEVYIGRAASEGSVFAQDNYLQYALNDDMSAFIVTGYTGTAKTVTIPDIYNGLRVIAIGDAAFKDNNYIEKIKLPNSIERIGIGAFSGCMSLKTVNLPDSISEIDDSAFNSCYKLASISVPSSTKRIGEKAFYRCLSLSSVLLNEGLLTIASQAFERCTALTSIVIPNTVNSIEMWAFNHAESLESVTLSTSMTAISTATFSGCYALHSVVIPANIHSIGNSAFSDCTHLAEVRILGNITTFGNSVFYKCVYLSSFYYGSASAVSLPENNYIFYNAGINSSGIIVILQENARLPQRLFEPVVNHQNAPYVIKILLESGEIAPSSDYLPYLITGIAFGERFVYNGEAHTMLVGNIPVGASVYYENNTRTELGSQIATVYVSIGYAVQKIDAALNVCLPTLTTQTNMPEAGAYTVMNAEDIEWQSNVTLIAGSNLGYTWLGWYDGDIRLTESLIYNFDMPAADKVFTAMWEVSSEMENYVFSSTESECMISDVKDKSITSAIVPDYVTSIEEAAFSGCASLEEITIPFVGGSRKTASDTDQYPFGYIFGTSSYTGGTAVKQFYYGSSTSSTTSTIYYIPTNLRSVTLTGGEILYHAFSNCSMLTSVTFRCEVTSIGSSAFYGCTGLTSVTIPDSVTSIGRSAFYGCTGLTSVTIGSGVTSIGDRAFNNCSGLTSIYYTGDVAGWCAISGLIYLMSYGSSSKSLYIGGSMVSDLEIPDSVTSIPDYAFYKCTGLTSVTIGSSVTRIGYKAFSDCKGLRTIYYQGSIAEWRSILKDQNLGNGDYTVHCSDGDA